jgi:uncharacterized protein YjiS (DUF1127 family)
MYGIFRHGIGLTARKLADWAERWEQRRALEDLDDHLLADIGVSRGDAAREAAQPFWRTAGEATGPSRNPPKEEARRSGGLPVVLVAGARPTAQAPLPDRQEPASAGPA